MTAEEVDRALGDPAEQVTSRLREQLRGAFEDAPEAEADAPEIEEVEAVAEKATAEAEKPAGAIAEATAQADRRDRQEKLGGLMAEIDSYDWRAAVDNAPLSEAGKESVKRLILEVSRHDPDLARYYAPEVIRAKFAQESKRLLREQTENFVATVSQFERMLLDAATEAGKAAGEEVGKDAAEVAAARLTQKLAAVVAEAAEAAGATAGQEAQKLAKKAADDFLQIKLDLEEKQRELMSTGAKASISIEQAAKDAEKRIKAAGKNASSYFSAGAIAGAIFGAMLAIAVLIAAKMLALL